MSKRAYLHQPYIDPRAILHLSAHDQANQNLTDGNFILTGNLILCATDSSIHDPMKILLSLSFCLELMTYCRKIIHFQGMGLVSLCF